MIQSSHKSALARKDYPDSKVHGANMGPIWGRQYPGGPHVGAMNFAIWVAVELVWNCGLIGSLFFMQY